MGGDVTKNKIMRCRHGNWSRSQSMTSHAGIHVHDRGDDAKTAVKKHLWDPVRGVV
jgi:hypothetical protein